jgi:uncharacterized membrane protein YkoI
MKNMKKLIAVALVAIMVVCGCTAACAEQKALTPEEAKTIALNYVGLTADQVTFVKCYTDWDDGRQVYEIKFLAGTTEYEMDVDLLTGRITDYDADRNEHHDHHHDDDDWDDFFDFD